jgi:hypothetical protein
MPVEAVKYEADGCAWSNVQGKLHGTYMCRAQNAPFPADQPDCPLYNSFDSARGMMAADFADQQNDDWKKPLSVLFNAFIMMQVGRGIGKEWSGGLCVCGNAVSLWCSSCTCKLQHAMLRWMGHLMCWARMYKIGGLATTKGSQQPSTSHYM